MTFTINEILNGKDTNGIKIMTDTSKKKVVSLVAYMLGVEKKHFNNTEQGYEKDSYTNMERNSQAKLIRCLNKVRSDLLKSWFPIMKKQKDQFPLSLSILNMPEYVDKDSMEHIRRSLIIKRKGAAYSVFDNPTMLMKYVNREIKSHINNCRNLFPEWVNWTYVTNLFIMPNGDTDDGIRKIGDTYRDNFKRYPFQLYLNWKFEGTSEEFILSNDERFVLLLYQQNGDLFDDMNKVTDLPQTTKKEIEDFVLRANKVVALVDCENSDPYALCAMVSGMNADTIKKISKIILIDDKNTIDAWRMLDKYIPVCIEHYMVERVLEQKSQVDMTLALYASREFYQENVDAFIIFSSDSDYWALINQLNQAKFLVMAERGKCSSELKNRLNENNVVYALIDSAYAADSINMQYDILLRQIKARLNERLGMDLKELIKDTAKQNRMPLRTEERENFFKRYVQTIQIGINADGKIEIETKAVV